jgi:hypothetical protein
MDGSASALKNARDLESQFSLFQPATKGLAAFAINSRGGPAGSYSSNWVHPPYRIIGCELCNIITYNVWTAPIGSSFPFDLQTKLYIQLCMRDLSRGKRRPRCGGGSGGGGALRLPIDQVDGGFLTRGDMVGKVDLVAAKRRLRWTKIQP